MLRASRIAPVVKNPLASAGDIRDMDLILSWKDLVGEGHSNQLHYSCLENPKDRAWMAIVHMVSKNWTLLK